MKMRERRAISHRPRLPSLAISVESSPQPAPVIGVRGTSFKGATSSTLHPRSQTLKRENRKKKKKTPRRPLSAQLGVTKKLLKQVVRKLKTNGLHLKHLFLLQSLFCNLHILKLRLPGDVIFACQAGFL